MVAVKVNKDKDNKVNRDSKPDNKVVRANKANKIKTANKTVNPKPRNSHRPRQGLVGALPIVWPLSSAVFAAAVVQARPVPPMALQVDNSKTAKAAAL